MNFVSAIFNSTLIECARASGEESPTEEPSATAPGFSRAPVRARIASSRLVLPLANGPTIAIDRGPVLRPLSLILPPLPQHGVFESPDCGRQGSRTPFSALRPALKPDKRPATNVAPLPEPAHGSFQAN